MRRPILLLLGMLVLLAVGGVLAWGAWERSALPQHLQTEPPAIFEIVAPKQVGDWEVWSCDSEDPLGADEVVVFEGGPTRRGTSLGYPPQAIDVRARPLTWMARLRVRLGRLR